MQTERPSPRQSSGAGFALIIVLWTLVLIGFIASQIVATARLETKIAGNLAANAAAEAAADGAVYQAIFSLMDPREDARWTVGEPARDLMIGDYRVTVQVRSEAARINPNFATPELLRAFFQAIGSSETSAQQLASAINGWVGAATTSPDAMQQAYRAAGLDYGPPAEPMETLDELLYVLGMAPEIYAAIRPYLSLYAPGEPDLTQADAVVAAAVAATGGSRSGAAPVLQRGDDTDTVRIVADAKSTKARAFRTAVVRFDRGTGGYTMLAWHDGFE